jgi:RNA polymerase sigma-70 factor (ECF subfamily)
VTAVADEAALIRRIQERAVDREAAFAELFARYRLRVFGLCRHIVATRADAEDATQEVFFALHRALPSFRGDSSLGTFVHRIAVRVAIRYRGKPRPDGGPLGDAPAPTTADPVEARQDHERLWRALGQLSIEHRTVLGLFAVEELGHREIAAVLGIPEGTVWSRLHLARKRLAALLEEEGPPR